MAGRAGPWKSAAESHSPAGLPDPSTSVSFTPQANESQFTSPTQSATKSIVSPARTLTSGAAVDVSDVFTLHAPISPERLETIRPRTPSPHWPRCFSFPATLAGPGQGAGVPRRHGRHVVGGRLGAEPPGEDRRVVQNKVAIHEHQ